MFQFFRNMLLKADDVPPRMFRFILSYSIPYQGEINPVRLNALKEIQERILKVLSSMTYAFCWNAEDLLKTVRGIVNFNFNSK